MVAQGTPEISPLLLLAWTNPEDRELIPEDQLEGPLHPGVAVATLYSQDPGGGGEWEAPA